MNSTDEYKIQMPIYESLAQRLQGLLQDLAKTNEIEIHAIEARAKTLESFTEKISRPGKTYENPLQDITDLCGVRVILYYQEDVHRLSEIIREEFEVDDKRSVDKRTELRSDQFGYISVHIICKIKDNRSTLPEWRKYKDLHAEIQVRTVLQHAWASISHALQYKSKSVIPEQFTRQLTRIAGLLELSDEQFSNLKEKTTVLRTEVSKSLANSDLKVEINSVSLEQFLSTSSLVINIENYARVAGFDTMEILNTNQLTATILNTDQLTATCNAFEILKLSDLSALLDAFLSYAPSFFKIFRKTRKGPCSGDRDHWTAIAVVAMKSGSEKEKFIVDAGIWSHDYLADLLRAAKQAHIKPFP
ncbi:GTP pyrophosphokinase [Delftia acidovorans]|uniref:GTP pyrophosphokinase n=1 Tax=Delftia acidovorans TaxID=80866 RepID=UPI0028AEB265|nr:hypothetical protein [Delftia acidovorans]